MTLRLEKDEDNRDVRPYIIIVDNTTLTCEPMDPTAKGSGLYDKEKHERDYQRQLEQMKAFHARLKDWISINGIAEQVKSLEDPKVPVGSLVLLCTPASAATIEQMPGVKSVIQEP